VLKVSDLPSPLDAVPGDRIIVRETEEVYGLDAATRMWSVIGTLKKVGGKKPEELAAHLDAETNPHKTTLAQVLATGATVQLDEKTGELVLEDKSGKLKALLRLLKNGGALRVGADVGNSTGTLWVNAGKKGSKATVLRVVEGDAGDDQFVLEADGSIKSAGTATFKGGVSGPTAFDDAVTAAEGVFGADAEEAADGDAFALELGSGRVRGTGKAAPIVFSLGTKGAKGDGKLAGRAKKATLSEKGLGIGTEPTEALDVAGNLKLSGTVSSDLSPTDDRKQMLGTLARRWRGVVAAAMGIAPETDETALIVSVKPGQKAPIILIGGQKTGDILALNQDGDLGLGTVRPDRKLDVQGSGIAVGAPAGKARTTLSDDGDGDVQLSFNRATDGSAEDDALHSWSLALGNSKRDAFEIQRRAKGGEWRSLLHVDAAGSRLSGDLTVSGAIKTTAPLASDSLNGATSGGKNGIALAANGASVDLFAKNDQTDGAVYKLIGGWKNPAKALAGLILDIADRGSAAGSSLLQLMLNSKNVFDFRKDGTLLGKSLGSEDAKWDSAFLSEKLVVGGASYEDGTIAAEGDIDLEASSGVVGVPTTLSFKGKTSAIKTGAAGMLSVDGEAVIALHTSKNAYGIDFPMGGAKVSGVGSMDVERLDAGTVVIDSEARELLVASAKGRRALTVTKDAVTTSGTLNAGGFAINKVQETVDITTGRSETKLKLPAGVRVEAVVATVIETLKDITFFQIGDAATPDRFLGPSTRVVGGAVSKGLNHCDRGQSVQQVEAPLVITTDAPPSGGKLLVTVFFMNPSSSA
jgi:hypothetical protein